MHVLQVNKFLYGKGGAETVMFRTADLLRAHAHDVTYFATQSDQNIAREEARYFPRERNYLTDERPVRRALDAGASIYSFAARRSLRRMLDERAPDVAHLHNIYHQLTLSILDELHGKGIPTVMTVHDYKPVCPNYLLYVEDEPCHRCVGSHPGHAIRHRCIKGSRAASVIAAAESLLVRARRLYDRVDVFISPSRYLADLLVEGGLPRERIHVIPNFVADEQLRAATDGQQPARARDDQERPSVLFVGRLEEVKGVRVLLAAAQRVAPALEVIVVGAGPLEAEVRAAAQEGSVRFLGRREWEEIAELMDRSAATVIPSIWEENCPMVALEAGARGCPVVASDRGGLAELVREGDDGFLFPAGDAEALAETLLRFAGDPALSARLGDARLTRTLEQNTAAAHLPPLLAAYRCAAERTARRPARGADEARSEIEAPPLPQSGPLR